MRFWHGGTQQNGCRVKRADPPRVGLPDGMSRSTQKGAEGWQRKGKTRLPLFPRTAGETTNTPVDDAEPRKLMAGRETVHRPTNGAFWSIAEPAHRVTGLHSREERRSVLLRLGATAGR